MKNECILLLIASSLLLPSPHFSSCSSAEWWEAVRQNKLIDCSEFGASGCQDQSQLLGMCGVQGMQDNGNVVSHGIEVVI
jgi:hypothetical protein